MHHWWLKKLQDRRDLCSNPSFGCCPLNTPFVSPSWAAWQWQCSLQKLCHCWAPGAKPQWAQWLLDNHDTHSRRGRSCPKNTNSAEIHSAGVKAVEEIEFSDCLVKPDKQHLACAALWGWGTSQVPLFMAPVRLCCFLGAWWPKCEPRGPQMPSGYAWEQNPLCISRRLTLFIFLLVSASIHAVSVFSLEKHNRAAWIHLRCFQKPNSNLMTQKLRNLCGLSSGNSHLCGQWPFHSEYMLPLIYLWAWVVYFSISTFLTIIHYPFFPPFFFTILSFVCLFCVLKIIGAFPCHSEIFSN